MTAIREGDVLQYEPRAGEEGATNRSWCREGIAVVEQGRGVGGASILVAYDTYWSSDRHRLTVKELETAELLFNVHDFEEVSAVHRSGVPASWEDFASDDRRTISGQHGHTMRYFVRKGAEPNHATMLANAEAAVYVALEAIKAAERQHAHAYAEFLRLSGGQS